MIVIVKILKFFPRIAKYLNELKQSSCVQKVNAGSWVPVAKFFVMAPKVLSLVISFSTGIN